MDEKRGKRERMEADESRLVFGAEIGSQLYGISFAIGIP
jgi:hypothetical protein